MYHLKYGRKVSGGILLECSLAIAILLICITLSLKFVKVICYADYKRYLKHKINEDLYAVSEEIKYNNSYEKMLKLMKDDEIKLKYDDEFIDNLKEKEELKDLERTTSDEESLRITVDKENTKDRNECYMIFNLEVNYKDINLKKQIVKGKWMDYV